MANIAYFRCSTNDQTIESQRHALPGPFDKEFADEGVSGVVVAMARPAFSAMASYAREGDTVFVTEISRLGRDSIDIQTTYRDVFKARGIRLYVTGLGYVEGEMGSIVLNLMAQFAQMDRERIIARTAVGKEKAALTFAATGKTHNGKATMGGRPRANDPAVVRAWRAENRASIAATAARFDISPATVKNYCRA